MTTTLLWQRTINNHRPQLAPQTAGQHNNPDILMVKMTLLMNKTLMTLASLASMCVPMITQAAELPDLDGREVIVVTENAYPPLQFVDPKSGEAIGWEYDAMKELAGRLNFKLVIENSSWDAMIPAISARASTISA